MLRQSKISFLTLAAENRAARIAAISVLTNFNFTPPHLTKINIISFVITLLNYLGRVFLYRLLTIFLQREMGGYFYVRKKQGGC